MGRATPEQLRDEAYWLVGIGKAALTTPQHFETLLMQPVQHPEFASSSLVSAPTRFGKFGPGRSRTTELIIDSAAWANTGFERMFDTRYCAARLPLQAGRPQHDERHLNSRTVSALQTIRKIPSGPGLR